MELRLLWIVMLAQVLLTVAILLVLPRIARRGLLFGVYVGEARWEGDEARAITRGWYVGMAGALVVSLLVGLTVGLVYPQTPVGPMVSIFVLVFLYPFIYLRAYFRARALALSEGAATAAAPLLPDLPATLAWPAFAIVVGLLGGGFAIAHAAVNYGDMPARVPTHFGIGGRPDAWAPRSFWTVMLLPIGTLIMGLGLGGVAWLTARAKRAIRARDGGVSVTAQVRFRTAMTRFLSGVAILTTLLMMLLSVAAVRVATGQAATLPNALMWVLLGSMFVYAVGGTVYLMFRYGQGGARLERAARQAPLTDGLADNTRWVLGAFYVNRDDPSLFVEKRFGMGYTINFGNPKAVALFVIFMAAILAFALIGILTGGTS